MSTATDFGLALHSGGVSLVLDFRGGHLPTVLHWGAAVGEITSDDLAALVSSRVPPLGASEPDEPVAASVLPEHTLGWQGRPGISGSRAGRAWSPEFLVDEVSIDGARLDGPSGIRNHGHGVVVVRAADAVTALGLEITIELTEAGVVRMRADLHNRADDEYQLDELLLCLPVPLQAEELLDFGGRWGRERAPQRHRVTQGTHRREGRRGRTGLDAATILSAGVPGFGFAAGEVWGVHTAWSGNHVHQLERMLSGIQLLGGGELLLPGEMRLAPDAHYRSPWVYGFYGDGLDAAARRAHRMLRARPQHPTRPRPITLNTWEAVYFDHDEKALTDLADLAADIGVERFVLDDGWFGARRGDTAGLGDWTVSKDAWPHGLGPLIQHVRGLGMEFGLWVEPEMVNVDSDLARAHPDWIMTARDRLPIEARNQQVLDMANPDCYAHIRDAMLTLLDENDIAYLKWDHNRDLVDAGTGASHTPGVHGQTEAYYRLVAELKAHQPGLEIEACSSGGGRVDLGALEHSDRIWVSDNNDPVDRTEINLWTSQLVAPELMGTHISSQVSHTTGRVHSLSFRSATALFGHLGIEIDLRTAAPEELDELRAWVGLHRELRDLLHGGDLVRLDHPDPSIVLHGVVAPDQSSALYSFTSLARSPLANSGRVRLPGLAAGRRYAVRPEYFGGPVPDSILPSWWDEGVELDGGLLGTVGLMPPALPPEQAVVLRVTAIEA
ncbi:alpha-galactosidase [Microbacterium sp. H1-D42]|uniref:alpha-galactosidase n=1 Tax=Microbacterium sp. H1-D42 TaxID=2925844 RepID=UPI001F52CE80|nr:alpha-galactosidase [Microbacterium sp. H1-D42]UNK72080.1 alpha-galactosidase [Microbacterium sp. H1-D42]